MSEIINWRVFVCRMFFLFFLFYLVYEQFWHILSVNVLVLTLFFLPYFFRQKYVLRIPFEIELIFLLFLIFASLVGQFLPSFAQFLFGLTFGLLGFVFIFIFLFNREKRIPFVFILFLSICISLALASIIEICKFYLKLVLGYDVFVGDFSFAVSNLVFVFIGSLISNFFGYLYLTKFRGKIFKSIMKALRAENPNLFISRTRILENAKKMIESGEGERIEFKSSLRMNLHTNQPDSRVEHAVLRSIASFLNSGGGFLFIGVSDKSEISGINVDNFENLDLFNRHLTNLIKENIGAEYLPYLGFDFLKFDNNMVLRISCMRSLKPVFLRHEGRDDFFIRIGASTILLSGNKMLDYIRNNFSNR